MLNTNKGANKMTKQNDYYILYEVEKPNSSMIYDRNCVIPAQTPQMAVDLLFKNIDGDNNENIVRVESVSICVEDELGTDYVPVKGWK